MRRIVTGLAATLLLVVLLIGMPVVLIAAGPIGLPHIELTHNGVWQALSRPDDGTLLLTLLKAVGWVSWAVMAFTLLAELIAGSRHPPSRAWPSHRAPHGLWWQPRWRSSSTSRGHSPNPPTPATSRSQPPRSCPNAGPPRPNALRSTSSTR